MHHGVHHCILLFSAWDLNYIAMSLLSFESGETQTRSLSSPDIGYTIPNKFYSAPFIINGLLPPDYTASHWEGCEKGEMKMPWNFLPFWTDVFLFGCLLSYYKSLTHFQSSYKVILVILYLLIWHFCGRMRAWGFLVCHLHDHYFYIYFIISSIPFSLYRTPII